MAREAGAEDISAKLESAIQEEVEEMTESPTVETGTKESEEKGTSPEGKKVVKSIPYTRFKEVNDAKRDLEEKFFEVQSKYDETATSLAKVTQMLESVKEDADMIKDIRAMARDPKMLPHIEAIDKRLKGIEDDIEETGEVDEKTIDKTKRLLEREQERLQNELSEQRSEILVSRADAIADKWLEALPEQYTEEDREIIAELWANRVDWEDVEEDPSNLMEILKETFQETVTKYGRPRGGLIDPEDPETYEIEVEDEPTSTPEEELAAIVKGRNLGGFKTVELSGRKTVQPEVPDDEFAEILAKTLRQGRK